MLRTWWIITLPTFLAFLALSVFLSVYSHQLFLLLVLPFVPFLFRWRTKPGPVARACPSCGWAATHSADAFCPRDGTKLEP